MAPGSQSHALAYVVVLLPLPPFCLPLHTSCMNTASYISGPFGLDSPGLFLSSWVVFVVTSLIFHYLNMDIRSSIKLFALIFI